ncbi:MBL fold metallo-hydrolase [Micrococcus luteus]
MTTELTLWGQSAVRLERDGRRIGFDPGAFSDEAVLEDVEAVLITHLHPDHVVPERVVRAVAAGAQDVWAPEDQVPQLAEAGVPEDVLHTAVPGESFSAGGFEVRVLGGQHALIHEDVPRPDNAAYLVDGSLLHPGDSFPALPEGVAVDTLLLPVSAPWMRISEAVEYARALCPRTAIPIHDAILSRDGRSVVDGMLPTLVPEGTEYLRLGLGQAHRL